jgi:hypothetical protein
MQVLAEGAAKFVCWLPIKWLAVPFLPLPSLVLPPLLLVWLGIMVAVHQSRSSVLNTKDGSKSWVRSAECTFGMAYCLMFLLSLVFVAKACKVVRMMPVVP